MSEVSDEELRAVKVLAIIGRLALYVLAGYAGWKIAGLFLP